MTTETARAVRPKGSAFRRQSPGAKLAGRSACMSGMARSSPGPGPHSLRLDRNQFPSWKVVMARSRRARAFSGKRTRWMKGCSSLGRLRFAVLLEAESSRTGRGWVCLWDGKGTNFAVFSRKCDQGGDLPVRPPAGNEELERIELPEYTDRDLSRLPARRRAGHSTAIACMALRARRRPSLQPNKLLLDPYARAHAGELNGTRPCSATRWC
jgi:hypothetical protein